MKKRFLALILSAVMLISCGIAAAAEDDEQVFTSGDYEYIVTDGAAEIVEFTDKEFAGELIIPDTLDGYPVKSIFDFSFGICANIEKVIISDGVEKIGNSAFMFCDGLKEVIIPDSVTTIEMLAFAGTALTEVNIPKSVVDIGEWVFQGTPLEKISVEEGNEKYFSAGNCIIDAETKTVITACKSSVIPNDPRVEKIGDAVFMGEYDGITDINIPANIKEIGASAFEESSLSKITLSEGLEKIGGYAFACCELSEITLPESLKQLGTGVFVSCENLKTVTVLNKSLEFDYDYDDYSDNYPDEYPYMGIFSDIFSENEDVILKCYENSTAHEYAKKYNIKTEFIKDEPDSGDKETDNTPTDGETDKPNTDGDKTPVQDGGNKTPSADKDSKPNTDADKDKAPAQESGNKTPVKGSNASGNEIPKGGDNTALTLWIGLAAVSAAAVLLFSVKKIKPRYTAKH